MDVTRFRMIDKIFFLIEWLSNHERYSDVNKLIEILDFELAQEYANLTDSEGGKSKVGTRRLAD